MMLLRDAAVLIHPSLTAAPILLGMVTLCCQKQGR
ncbi:hypothetical protein YPC_4149 [Yersinia pestis biovar Medievalis str. Harbin 35]|nr:hypothetical protein YPC_4149 [Yersinia pestis biovar Medievalis str. Harbin 35]EEO82769.1 hypothetical protein YPF_0742 [Yersinia pestis biovar Orientalis str. India 195]